MKTFFSFGLVLIAFTAHAGSFGTRGGGNSIDVNGRPTLRDLVDKSSCMWKSGKDVLSEEPYLEGVLDSLGKMHVLFREIIRRETLKLNYCFTDRDLVRVNTEDAQFTVVEGESGAQAAIRLEKDVYIDSKIFRAMDEHSRAFLIIHEVMHSFIPLWAEHRNSKLRSTVRYLAQMEFSPEKIETLFLYFKRNEVGLPSDPATLKTWDEMEEGVQKASDKSTSLKDRLVVLKRLSQVASTTGGAYFSMFHDRRLQEMVRDFDSLKQIWRPGYDRPLAFDELGTQMDVTFHEGKIFAKFTAEKLALALEHVPSELFEALLEVYGENMELNRYVTFDKAATHGGKVALFVGALPAISTLCLAATVMGADLNENVDFDRHWQEAYPMYFLPFLNDRPANAARYEKNLEVLRKSSAVDLNLEAYLSKKNFENKRNGLSLDEAIRRHKSVK